MKNIFLDLVCIQPTCSQACLAHSDAIILFFLPGAACPELRMLLMWSLSFIALHLSSPFTFIFAHPPPRGPLTLSLSAPPHIYSSFFHWVDDSLVFESCAFCSMICSVVSLLLPGVSLFLLLLHPGSQPTLTYVSASHVLIFQPYKTVFYWLSPHQNSLLLFLTRLNAPSLCPKPLFLSTQLYVTTPTIHGRTSWDRSTVHLERSWVRLLAAWRNL